MRGLIPLKAAVIYLVGDDSSFYPAYCSPPDALPELEKRVATLSSRTERSSGRSKSRKPVLTEFKEKRAPLLLHVLSTISRTRGMLVGVMDKGWEEISDYALSSLRRSDCKRGSSGEL